MIPDAVARLNLPFFVNPDDDLLIVVGVRFSLQNVPYKNFRDPKYLYTYGGGKAATDRDSGCGDGDDSSESVLRTPILAFLVLAKKPRAFANYTPKATSVLRHFDFEFQ